MKCMNVLVHVLLNDLYSYPVQSRDLSQAVHRTEINIIHTRNRGEGCYSQDSHKRRTLIHLFSNQIGVNVYTELKIEKASLQHSSNRLCLRVSTLSWLLGSLRLRGGDGGPAAAELLVNKADAENGDRLLARIQGEFREIELLLRVAAHDAGRHLGKIGRRPRTLR